MSSLSGEQQKRIEENRARALAKLAQKRPNSVDGGFGTTSKQSSNSTCIAHSNAPSNRGGTTRHLSRFDYIRETLKYGRPGKDNQRTSTKRHNKTVNSELMKARVTKGTCVLISRTRFKVVIGFHAKLIGVMKSLSSKSYDAQTRTWNFLLEDYEKLMSLCQPLASEVALLGLPKEVLRLFISKKKEDSPTEICWDLIDKKLVDSLMPFQREGVIFSIKQNGRVLLADDMGLGKTIQAIAVASYYRTKWPLLVVVPSSLRMTWRRAVLRWLPSVKPVQVNVVFTGKDSPNAGLVNIISYDLLTKKIGEIQKVGYKVIIVDECHAIKNHKTERTKAVLPLCKASSHVILISGTPALSRPSELHTQISAVNPKLFPSYHHYGIRYCDAVQNHFGWDYSGSSNMEELQLILEECIMIRRLKKLVLDQLPSKTREVVYLDPSLVKVKSVALAESEQKLVKAPKKGKRDALLVYFTETCSVKAAAVTAYILDLLEGGHKIIVFAHHQVMLNIIGETLMKKKIEYIRIDGKTLSSKRQHLCDQFQRNTETRAAVFSLTAANTGLTLTAATCVVFAELFWNPGTLVQAEDRAYRIGQKNSVVIHYLIAKKTADDYLWPLIQKKLDVLSEAGLNKENFSDLDAKTFQDPRQRDLEALFASMIEEMKDDDSFVEECLKDDNSNAVKCDEGVLSTVFSTGKRRDEPSETKYGGESSQASSTEEHVNMKNCGTNCGRKTASADCGTNETQKSNAKLWREWNDSEGALSSGNSSQASLMNDTSEDWFDDIGNDDWDDLCIDTLEDNMEPNSKRKRF